MSHPPTKLAILDRDGVINHDSDGYIKSPEEWIPIEGSLQAIARLNRAGYRIFIATNQSGLGRGLFSIETLHRIHHRMLAELECQGGRVDGILFCPHIPEEQCNCRKPRPGLLYEIAQRANQGLKGIPVIGDSYRDLQAALAVEASPILVRTGKGERTLRDHAPELGQTPVFDDLAGAVDMLIRRETSPS